MNKAIVWSSVEWNSLFPRILSQKELFFSVFSGNKQSISLNSNRILCRVWTKMKQTLEFRLLHLFYIELETTNDRKDWTKWSLGEWNSLFTRVLSQTDGRRLNSSTDRILCSEGRNRRWVYPIRRRRERRWSLLGFGARWSNPRTRGTLGACDGLHGTSAIGPKAVAPSDRSFGSERNGKVGLSFVGLRYG